MWGSHGDVSEQCALLSCNVVYFSDSPTFRWNITPPSYRSKSKPRKQPVRNNSSSVSSFILKTAEIFSSESLALPKVHCITTQKTVPFTSKHLTVADYLTTTNCTFNQNKNVNYQWGEQNSIPVRASNLLFHLVIRCEAHLRMCATGLPRRVRDRSTPVLIRRAVVSPLLRL
jgi:hypothetical protein